MTIAIRPGGTFAGRAAASGEELRVRGFVLAARRTLMFLHHSLLVAEMGLGIIAEEAQQLEQFLAGGAGETGGVQFIDAPDQFLML